MLGHIPHPLATTPLATTPHATTPLSTTPPGHDTPLPPHHHNPLATTPPCHYSSTPQKMYEVLPVPLLLGKTRALPSMLGVHSFHGTALMWKVSMWFWMSKSQISALDRARRSLILSLSHHHHLWHDEFSEWEKSKLEGKDKHKLFRQCITMNEKIWGRMWSLLG